MPPKTDLVVLYEVLDEVVTSCHRILNASEPEVRKNLLALAR